MSKLRVTENVDDYVICVDDSTTYYQRKYSILNTEPPLSPSEEAIVALCKAVLAQDGGNDAQA